ncbi:MAG: lysophospholipid acyltransferase family protein [Pirellulaceae bacterium]
MQDTIAHTFVIMMALAPVWLVFIASRCIGLSPLQTILWSLSAMYCLFMWRGRLNGRLPKTTRGAILIANHRSSADALIMQMSCNRPIGWLIAAEYMQIPILGQMMRYLGAIPAGRSGKDSKATRNAIAHCQDGGLLGLFPEGRLNKTDEFMQSVRPGLVLIAARAGVPIIPFHIEGGSLGETAFSPFLRRGRIKATLGSPIHVETPENGSMNKKEIIRWTRKCVTAIAELGGHDDFEVIIAGRKWRPD